MAIAVDARSSGAQSFPAGASVSGATSMSWTHTLGAALSNEILIVTVGQDAAANSTSAVWDDGATNVALTRKSTVSQGNCRAEHWYLKATISPTGAKTIRVSWTGSHDGCGGSASYSGVDQTTVFNASSPQTSTGAGGTNPSLPITTTSGELAIDCIVTDNTGAATVAPSKGASQTYISAGINVNTSSICAGGSDQAATGTSLTHTWTVDPVFAGAWGQVGISLLPSNVVPITTAWYTL